MKDKGQQSPTPMDIPLLRVGQHVSEEGMAELIATHMDRNSGGVKSAMWVPGKGSCAHG